MPAHAPARLPHRPAEGGISVADHDRPLPATGAHGHPLTSITAGPEDTAAQHGNSRSAAVAHSGAEQHPQDAQSGDGGRAHVCSTSMALP
ncbi:hypothetical protein [Salinispora vitiensis]|uniref:hypothetical protein n=1 Tax=Salinispora vitiensis TaxID=999544 RepID=UPI00053474B3|nr:hypothetical protein [Salinispora vitiensis]